MSEQKVAPGLLLAMPQLQDPNFARSVVLMVEHTREGSFGLIVNRPTAIPVERVMRTLEIEWHGASDAVVWMGGPVMPGTGWLLHEPAELPGGGHVAVTPEILLSTSPENLRALAEDPPGRLRFLMGYSGWGPAQLESELAIGSWLIVDARAALIFDTPPEEMWETALRSLGIDPATLVPAAGIH